MLATYTESIGTGLLLFVLCGSVVLPIVAAVQHARHGVFRRGRFAVHAGTLLYGTTALGLLFFPLPAAGSCYGGQTVQPVPFRWVSDAQREAAQNGIAAISTPAVVQLLFNIALFVPFGVVLAGVHRRGTSTTVGAAAATSLLVEVAQLTGNFGMYECAYRIGDVDDLITNTTGAAIGCLAVRLFVPAGKPAPDVPTPWLAPVRMPASPASTAPAHASRRPVTREPATVAVPTMPLPAPGHQQHRRPRGVRPGSGEAPRR